MTESEKQIYPRVRALERGLEIVDALSQVGWATPSQLAKYTGINRATIYRLLHTLEQNGYVYCRLEDGSYFLTHRFRNIADGVKDEDWVSQVISPHLGNLLSQVRWPSDFAMLTSGRLVIRESTHRFSPMSIHRAMVGKEVPLLRSSLGIAFLSAVSDESREQILSLASLAADDKNHLANNRDELMRQIRFARARSYAESVGGADPHLSGIAYPVCWRNYVLGSVNIMFFARAMSPTEVAERYLHHLHACVHDIEKELNEIPLGENTGWLKRKDLKL